MLYKLIDELHEENAAETTETVLHMLNKYPGTSLELGSSGLDFTPLHRCIIQEADFPNTCFGDPFGKDIGHALVAKGANVAYGPGLQAPNCLLLAVIQEQFLVAKSLWLAGADKDLVDSDGYSGKFKTN